MADPVSLSRLADFSTLPFFPFSSSRVYPVRRGFVIILAIQLIPVHETVLTGARREATKCNAVRTRVSVGKRDQESKRRDYETRYVERENMGLDTIVDKPKDEENVSVEGGGTMRRGR